MRIRYWSFLAALVVSLTGGVSSSATGTYESEYFCNFENAVLTPKGTTDQWCLSGDMSKAELPATGPSGRWGTAYVTVRGDLGPDGKYGNLGSCSRVLAVKEVLSVSNMRSVD